MSLSIEWASNAETTMLEQIIKKIQQKGWEVYMVDMDPDVERAIEVNAPAPSLTVGSWYTINPKINHPTTAEQICNEQERLEQRGIVPKIYYNERWFSLNLFKVKENAVYIINLVPLVRRRLTYPQFYDALQSLPITMLTH